MKPAALASALQKITGEIAAIPQKDLRASKAMNAFFIAPAISGATLKTLTSTHPSLEQRLEQLARIQAELGRARRRPDGLLGRRPRAPYTSGAEPRRAVPVPSAAITLQTGIGLDPAGTGSVCFRAAEGAAFRQMQAEVVDADQRRPRGAGRGGSTDTRLHLADRRPGRRDDVPASAPTCTP